MSRPARQAPSGDSASQWSQHCDRRRLRQTSSLWAQCARSAAADSDRLRGLVGRSRRVDAPRSTRGRSRPASSRARHRPSGRAGTRRRAVRPAGPARAPRALARRRAALDRGQRHWVWLLHQTSDGDIGGVKSRFSRTGMHSRWTDHRPRSYHVGELSWPADPWFIAGELHGPRAQRLRLIGLLAADELGVRHLVTRTDASSSTRDNIDHENGR